jgi:DNA primase
MAVRNQVRIPLLCSISMPGIDYAQLRGQVRIEQVLEHAGFVAAQSHGDQQRGPCPIHGSSSPTSTSFSVNLSLNSFRCFRCGAQGNQLDLWAAITKLPLHAACLDLCERLNLKPPLAHRW